MEFKMNIFYKNISQASLSVIALKINSQKEYGQRYTEDPKLPSNPLNIYNNDWNGWQDYLGVSALYATIEEASDAACKLGIKS